jgi:hypothetical protein
MDGWKDGKMHIYNAPVRAQPRVDPKLNRLSAGARARRVPSEYPLLLAPLRVPVETSDRIERNKPRCNAMQPVQCLFIVPPSEPASLSATYTEGLELYI